MYVGVMGKGDKKKAWLIESYREGNKVKKRLHQCFGYISEINRDDPDAFDKLKAKYSNQEDPEQKRLRESNAVLERTGATPQRATTATRTKNEMILISFFIAELLQQFFYKIKTPDNYMYEKKVQSK